MARLALASLTVIMIASFSRALTLDMPQLPAPAFTDREVSTDVNVPATAQEHLRSFRLVLSFAATPSNNVQVAFGQDSAPADGKLAAEETAFIIGWDSGEWFLRPSGLKERHTCAPTDGQTARRRTRQKAGEVGGSVFDLSGLYTGNPRFTDDGFHLSVGGNQEVARILFTEIAKAVGEHK